MRRVSERGSVIGFVIVGVALAVLAVGGVYALSKYNESKTSDTSTTESNNETAAPADNSTTNTPQPAQTNDTKSSDTPAVTATPQPATQSVPSSSAGLPQTGPVDTFVTMLMCVLLAVGATAYIRSRRAAASL